MVIGMTIMAPFAITAIPARHRIHNQLMDFVIIVMDYNADV